MSDNPTPTSNAADPTPPAPRRGLRVHGSIRITVTVTAGSAEEARRAVPETVQAAMAGIPGAPAVLGSDGLATGAALVLPGQPGQPTRYRVPVTVHGHLDLVGRTVEGTGDPERTDADSTECTDDGADLVDLADGPAEALALARLQEHLTGRDGILAQFGTAICDHVEQLPVAPPAE